MKKRSLCVLFTLLAIGGSPAPAHAEIGWWDYLEQMSGPGPFDRRGPLGIFTIDTGCRAAGARRAARSGGSRWIFLNSTDCAARARREDGREAGAGFLLAAAWRHVD